VASMNTNYKLLTFRSCFFTLAIQKSINLNILLITLDTMEWHTKKYSLLLICFAMTFKA